MSLPVFCDAPSLAVMSFARGDVVRVSTLSDPLQVWYARCRGEWPNEVVSLEAVPMNFPIWERAPNRSLILHLQNFRAYPEPDGMLRCLDRHRSDVRLYRDAETKPMKQPDVMVAASPVRGLKKKTTAAPTAATETTTKPQVPGSAYGVLMPFVWYGERILFVEESDGFHVTLEDPKLPRRTSAVAITDHQARALSSPTETELEEYFQKSALDLPKRHWERCDDTLIDAFLDAAELAAKKADYKAAAAKKAEPAREFAGPVNPSDVGVAMYDPATIRPSPFNRLTDLDDPEFRDLVEDVRKNGVLQNGILRTAKDAEPGIEWELIAGEGRWRAAMLTGQMFPARIHECGDTEAIELQAIENMKRRNLKPLDEGAKYQQLLGRYEEEGLTRKQAVAKIVEITGKGESTIYARMALLKLPEETQRMVRAGTLSASHAELLTKVQDEASQAELAAQFVKPIEDYFRGAKTEREMSFREAKVLTDAKVKELESEAEWQRQSAEHHEKGCKVLTLKQSEGVFSYMGLKAGYVGVGDKCDLDPDGRTWKALLGKHAPQAMVAKGGYNKQVRVIYARKAAEKGLAAAGVKFKAKPNVQEQRKRDEEREKVKEAKRFANDSARVAKLVTAAENGQLTTEVLRVIAWDMNGGKKSILLRRGLIAEGDQNYAAEQRAWDKLVTEADAKTLRGVIVELTLWEWRGLNAENVRDLGKAFGISTKGGKSGDA